MHFLSSYFKKNLNLWDPIKNEASREKESESIQKNSEELIPFYALPEKVDLREITQDLLKSSSIKNNAKRSIRNSKRRFFVFTYPSDGLKIKGIVSFVPTAANHSTLILLRGGNNNFALPNPGNELMRLSNYTVLTTTYRGGVSEGKDEFGGSDLNDVKNLVDYIPTLQKKLSVAFQSEKMFMLGRSRGGMQMFLTLAKFPDLQSRFSKVISLCGILDMKHCVASRVDMKQMFSDEFGLKPGVNEEEWIDQRNPVGVIEKIKKTLPIVIIQGTKDNRVALEEGYHMVNALQKSGMQVSYLEFEGGDHCLNNLNDLLQLVINCLESDVK